MSWAVVTAATGPHLALLDIGRPTMQRYAETHGMAFLEDTECMVGSLPPSWYKVPLLIDALSVYEGVLWIDADAMFMRYDVDVRDVATGAWNWVVNEYDVHWRPDKMLAPCAGVLALTPEAVPLLEAVWDLRDKYANHPWWEQAAAHELTGWDPCCPDCKWVGETQWSSLVGVLPREWDSTPADPHPDPVVFHASGIGFDSRVTLMTRAAA